MRKIVASILALFLSGFVCAQETDTTTAQPSEKMPEVAEGYADSLSFHILLSNDSLSIRFKEVTVPMESTEQLGDFIRQNDIAHISRSIFLHTDTADIQQVKPIVEVLRNNGIFKFSLVTSIDD